MYICICNQVTDRQIQQAVNDGVSSFSEIQSELGVATKCGECKNHARQCMRRSRAQFESNMILERKPSGALVPQLA